MFRSPRVTIGRWHSLQTIAASAFAALLLLSACSSPAADTSDEAATDSGEDPTALAEGDTDATEAVGTDSGGTEEAVGAAAGYPSESINLIITRGSGGSTDIAGRLIARNLEQTWDANIVETNEPGGGGLVGVRRLVRAEPDGYTLAVTPLPSTNVLYLDPERPVDFGREDIMMVSQLTSDPIAIAVSPDGPYSSLDDLVAAAEENPGALTTGSSGLFGTAHLGALAIEEAADVEFSSAFFEESGILRTALINGDIALEVGTLAELAPAHEEGQIKIVAALTEEPLPELPDVQTATEQGYDVVLSSRLVLVAPAGTPPEIVSKIDTAIADLMSQEDFQESAAEQFLTLEYRNSEDLQSLSDELDATFGPIIEGYREREAVS